MQKIIIGRHYGVTQNKHRSEWRQPGEVKEILEIVNRS